MPYVAEENMIKTKIINIATNVDLYDRQKVMKALANKEIDIRFIYLKNREVWFTMDDGSEYHMGDIKSKYADIVAQNVTQVVSWQITGGYQLAERKIEIVGQPTLKTPSMRAKYGMNIYIKLN